MKRFKVDARFILCNQLKNKCRISLPNVFITIELELCLHIYL